MNDIVSEHGFDNNTCAIQFRDRGGLPFIGRSRITERRQAAVDVCEYYHIVRVCEYGLTDQEVMQKAIEYTKVHSAYLRTIEGAAMTGFMSLVKRLMEVWPYNPWANYYEYNK